MHRIEPSWFLLGQTRFFTCFVRKLAVAIHKSCAACAYIATFRHHPFDLSPRVKYGITLNAVVGGLLLIHGVLYDEIIGCSLRRRRRRRRRRNSSDRQTAVRNHTACRKGSADPCRIQLFHRGFPALNSIQLVSILGDPFIRICRYKRRHQWRLPPCAAVHSGSIQSQNLKFSLKKLLDVYLTYIFLIYFSIFRSPL